MYCVQQRTRFRLVSTFLVLALQSPALRSRHPRALVKSGPDSTISWGRINIKTYKKTIKNLQNGWFFSRFPPWSPYLAQSQYSSVSQLSKCLKPTKSSVSPQISSSFTTIISSNIPTSPSWGTQLSRQLAELSPQSSCWRNPLGGKSSPETRFSSHKSRGFLVDLPGKKTTGQ